MSWLPLELIHLGDVNTKRRLGETGEKTSSESGRQFPNSPGCRCERSYSEANPGSGEREAARGTWA